MFGYYTALLLVTASIILAAIIVIYNVEVLEKLNRNIFILSYVILLFVCAFEWLATYLEKNNSDLNYIATISMSFVLFLAPSIAALLAWGINDKKSKFISHLVGTIVALNFMVGFSGLFSKAIFFYDNQSVYHRGEYFYIHLIMALISGFSLFINTFRLGVKYQNKNNYILVLDFMIFLGALLVQFTLNGIWILWPSTAIAIALVYIYFCSLVNQVDVLTGILNRKCFESQIYDIKSNAILLIIDVNKFKEINDTEGHVVGDYCLVEIAKAIKSVYGNSGYCYRIGGDEFSVILYKNLDSLENLNLKLKNKLTKEKYLYELPSISIGYSYYYPDKSSIQKVIEEADGMMYQLKQEKSLPDFTS